MKRILIALILLFVVLFVGGIQRNGEHVVSAETTTLLTPTTTITYTPTTEQFANPERGFYKFLDMYSSNPFTWWDGALTTFRTEQDISLVYCVFILDTFKTSDITPAFLTTIEDNFDAVRRAGLKCILRFAYTYDPSPDNNNDNEPDPPYGDANKQQVLDHIAQLEPIIQANSDVILVWQAGFIGIWGEWYYTDYFLEETSLYPSAPTPWIISEAMHANRFDVTSAMLDALPDSRMLQVRYPHAKISFPTFDDTPLPAANAFDNSDRARIGYHNDCFLASDTDFGTFSDASDRTFMAAETQYMPMGGETCNVNPPRSNCPTAVAELAQFHYTYLNIDYNTDVLDGWKTVAQGNCYPAIEKALGYRLALTSGEYQTSVRPGDSVTLALNLTNSGYAAPINPRPVKVLLSGSSGVFSAELTTDIRTWSPENSPLTLNETLSVPSCIPAGSYDLLLHLPDADSDLAPRPEYAIRLANSGIWQAATGYNDLNIAITVSGSAAVNGNGSPTGSFGNAACTPTSVAMANSNTLSSGYLLAPVVAVLLAALAIVVLRRDHSPS